MNCIRYVIWHLKLEKRIPLLGIVKNELSYTVRNITNCSKKILLLINSCQLFKQYGE